MNIETTKQWIKNFEDELVRIKTEQKFSSDLLHAMINSIESLIVDLKEQVNESTRPTQS